MSGPISQPPMAYHPNHDLSIRYSQPSSHSNDNVRQPPQPIHSQTISLGREIHEAYEYRSPNATEIKDSESMSDATSATYSRTASVHDNKYNTVYSPTFSVQSRVEEGSLEYGDRQSHSRNRDTVPSNNPYPSRDPTRHSDAPIVTYMTTREEVEDGKDHAVWILIWLSLFDPFYSLVGAIYAMITLFIVLLLTPLRLCDSTGSSKKTTVQLLSPILHKHLRILHVDLEEFREYRAFMLVLVYLVAPLASFGVAIAAYVSAGFWIFALIMGNPDGTERGDDGRNTILAVRNWWAKYLTKALR